MAIKWRVTSVLALGAAVWLSCDLIAPGEEVSRTPPADYRESMAGLLTPFEKLPQRRAESASQQQDGVILLKEEFEFVDRDGRRLVAVHSICKALDDAGARQLEQQTFEYRKTNQKFHLAQARTLQSDGSSQPVNPEGVFLKSPQPDADRSLYDDVGEVVLIFPNVKAGSITETTVVYEEAVQRIPGEFTFGHPWLAGWPVLERRLLVELPLEVAARLKITASGSPEPDYRKQDLGMRVRYSWFQNDIPAGPPELNRPLESRFGPVLWGTTLSDWDAFGKWYAGLVAGRSQLKPSLAKKVEAWTRGASGPREIADILARKVANEVRYTGLEFGNSDLQPHDCNEVWENQYGDCKDKANLLRAMLATKGISSHLAVLEPVMHFDEIDLYKYSHFRHQAWNGTQAKQLPQ